MSEELNTVYVKIDVYDGNITIKCDDQQALNDIVGVIECNNLDKIILTTRH